MGRESHPGAAAGRLCSTVRARRATEVLEQRARVPVCERGRGEEQKACSQGGWRGLPGQPGPQRTHTDRQTGRGGLGGIDDTAL